MPVKATFIIFSVEHEENVKTGKAHQSQWKQRSQHDSTHTHTEDKHQGVSVPVQQGKSARHGNMS